MCHSELTRLRADEENNQTAKVSRFSLSGACFTASTTTDRSGENDVTAANCTCWLRCTVGGVVCLQLTVVQSFVITNVKVSFFPIKVSQTPG